MSDLIIPTRRGFIAGLVSLIAAPAIVRATSLDFVPRALRPLEVLDDEGAYMKVGDHVFSTGREWIITQIAKASDVPEKYITGDAYRVIAQPLEASEYVTTLEWLTKVRGGS